MVHSHIVVRVLAGGPASLYIRLVDRVPSPWRRVGRLTGTPEVPRAELEGDGQLALPAWREATESRRSATGRRVQFGALRCRRFYVIAEVELSGGIVADSRRIGRTL